MEVRRCVIGFVVSISLAACTRENANQPMEASANTVDTAEFPKVIDGGKRVVYQFSKMTPRGMRYFTDTVDYRGDLTLPFLRGDVIFPLIVTEPERESAKGVVAISLPGYFDETIIGIIDDGAHLKLKIENTDVVLQASDAINYRTDNFSAAFQADRFRVDVAAMMKTTPTGTHRAGRGTLFVHRADSLLQSCEIFLVLKL